MKYYNIETGYCERLCFEDMWQEGRCSSMSMPSPDFDSIKWVNPYGVEYWSARELAPLLGYDKWQNFDIAIQRAMANCNVAGQEFSSHFLVTTKTALLGKGGKRYILDYLLTRYALHLILVNSDTKKSEIARALACFTLVSLEKGADYKKLVKEFNISIPENIVVTKEQKTISQIIQAFKHIPAIPQYRVFYYYIDLYFPQHKIAVECDEEDHRRYTQESEQTRQRRIMNALKCTFIRYNPDSKNFNIGDVIHRIMVSIYEEKG